MIPFYQQKTFWTILAGMISAVGGYFAGEVTAPIMVGAVFTGLAGIFTRLGIESAANGEVIPLLKQKTFWTAIAGMLTAGGGYVTGEIGVVGLVGAAFLGLGTIFGRQGIAKIAKPQQSDDRGVSLS
jgi:uncharacterized membrane protein